MNQTATKNEVFNLKGEWRLIFGGAVPSATWAERGPAEAQLALLESGYSVILSTGSIKHVGAGK